MSEILKRQIEKYLLLNLLAILGLITLVVLVVFAGGTPYIPMFGGDSLYSAEARYVVYAELERNESDLYFLEFEAGELINLSLIVPDKILSEVRSPAIKIFGPDLELVYSDDERVRAPNSVSLKKWVLVQPVQFEVPETGKYFLEVYDEVGEPGEYGLWLEGRDPIKINELFKMLVGTIRLNLGF